MSTIQPSTSARRIAAALLGAALIGAAGFGLAVAADEKPAGATPPAQKAAESWSSDAAKSGAAPAAAAATGAEPKELPARIIPNVPESAEAYYAPDNLHVIAQTQDAKAQHAGEGRATGALTYTFTDTGEDIRRINDHGQDACSWFTLDGKHLIWTSTRDHMDWPLGNWSEPDEYPTGAELYMSDLNGKHVKRLTNNKYYDAEVTSSLDGKWIFFGRQIDGKDDIWRMHADGTHQQQLTFTDDWEEGAPYPMPDGKHIIFRAWKKSDHDRLKKQREETGKRDQTPMTIFTMNLDGTDVQPRTFTKDMNWAPYPAPDGRHFFYVRIFEGNNWEVVMNDLAGGEPQRITINPSFDGFPSVSWDGKKMLFARSEGKRFMAGLHTWVMDISSLKIGPENYKGSIPEKAARPAGWVEDPDIADFAKSYAARKNWK
jgi:TolB protein